MNKNLPAEEDQIPKQIYRISSFHSTRLTSGIRQNLQFGGQIQQRGRTLDNQPRLPSPTGYAKNSCTTNTLKWKYGTKLSPKL